jgi:TATA-binding protein-associated factor
LDKLFHLVETGSTLSIRCIAAAQIGEAARHHSISTLLRRILPLLHSKTWDTRIAAANAVEQVARASLSDWDPLQVFPPNESTEVHLHQEAWLKIQFPNEFMVENEMKPGALLAGKRKGGLDGDPTKAGQAPKRRSFFWQLDPASLANGALPPPSPKGIYSLDASNLPCF